MEGYNTAYLAVPQPKRKAGRAHQDGTCGGMADLCGECHRQEWEWHKAVTLLIVRETPPQANESHADYWRRIGGHFYDTWYECAAFAFQQAK